MSSGGGHVATPGKVKAFLATVKETVLDPETEATASSSSSSSSVSWGTLYTTLVRLELLQRGWWVPLAPTDMDSADTDKATMIQTQIITSLLSAIQAVAGKALLTNADTTTLPTALVAATCAMQGRVAELMATRLATTTTEAAVEPKDDPVLRQALSKQVIAPVVQRCQQVQEDRLLLLLQIVSIPQDVSHHQERPQLWWTVAEGCYYRAASFAPDAPPMWKRAWECHQNQQQYVQQQRSNDQQKTTLAATTTLSNMGESHGTLPALEALYRIMKKKGNDKRARELALRLSSAWLDDATCATQRRQQPTDTTKASNQHLSLLEKVQCAFLVPFRNLSVVTPSQAVTNAATCLAQVDASSSPSSSSSTLLSIEDTWFYRIVSLQLILVQNRVELAAAIHDKKEQTKNRSSGGGGGSTSLDSSTKSHDLAQQTHYTTKLRNEDSNNSNVGLEFEKAELLLQGCVDGTSPGDHLKASAFAVLTNFIRYRYEMTVAVQKSAQSSDAQLQDCWTRLAAFLTTSIETLQEPVPGDNTNLRIPGSMEERSFLEEVSHMVCSVSWMTLCFHMESRTVLSFSHHTFNFVNRFTTTLCDEHRLDQTSHAKTAAVSSKAQAEEIHWTRLRLAQFTSHCWALFCNESLSPDLILEVTKDLILLLKLTDDFVQLDASYGASFLGSILVWSGFVRIPWEFATAPEARNMVQKARLVLKKAESLFNKGVHTLENLLLDVAEGDLEARGLMGKAAGLYNKVLNTEFLASKTTTASTITARCYLGLAGLSASASNTISDDFSTKGLGILDGLPDEKVSFMMWKHTSFLGATIRYQKVVAKQLISETLIHAGKVEQAGEFLQSSVEDAPMDETASFAFASFLLRKVFFHSDSSPESQKKAQMQLLSAAKLNPNSAGPFALLGYWYESKKDIKRAKGCYSKALLLEPSHPVAGRGFLRLERDGDNLDFPRKALASTSSLNGWAWREIAQQKAQVDCEDELAISALLKATRSRDIEDPFADPLAVFYSGPLAPQAPSSYELVLSLQDLAACYKRLGRCSAELRTLQSALEVAGQSPSWSLLYTCGQAEMEMGLIEEARIKFERAASISSAGQHNLSLFRKGMAEFMMGQRDLKDGKAGIALGLVNDAIESCAPLVQDSCTISKLLGDMHTFLAAFPSELFHDGPEEMESLDRHLETVRKGANFYSSSLEILKDCGSIESVKELEAGLVCDKGVNMLLCAQLTAQRRNLSLRNCATDANVMGLFGDAEACFVEALQINPFHIAAWCGLGCSLIGDPLKAQHAFGRAIELDASSPNPYANLGFLYLERGAVSEGAEMCDALTQVADTPMTWINRAYQLEASLLEYAEVEDQNRLVEWIRQASDAYRAALQVDKDPSALLGLAISFRMMGALKNPSTSDAWENGVLVKEYQTHTSANVPNDILFPLAPGYQDETFPEAILATKHRILEQPNNGRTWLSLCKQLLLELSEWKDENTMTARAAAAHARQLLLGQITTPSTNKDGDVNVLASSVSDALGIESFLDVDNDSASGKSAQLALLMCPQNALARELLYDCELQN